MKTELIGGILDGKEIETVSDKTTKIIVPVLGAPDMQFQRDGEKFVLQPEEN